MLRRDRWRLGLVAIVVVAALVTVFPISGKINLGLDLKGGAHIVLQAKESEDSKVTGQHRKAARRPAEQG